MSIVESTTYRGKVYILRLYKECINLGVEDNRKLTNCEIKRTSETTSFQTHWGKGYRDLENVKEIVIKDTLIKVTVKENETFMVFFSKAEIEHLYNLLDGKNG